MRRLEWNLEFANIIIKKANVTMHQAMQIADTSDDSFNDGESPSDAVDTELSYWGD